MCWVHDLLQIRCSRPFCEAALAIVPHNWNMFACIPCKKRGCYHNWYRISTNWTCPMEHMDGWSTGYESGYVITPTLTVDVNNLPCHKFCGGLPEPPVKLLGIVVALPSFFIKPYLPGLRHWYWGHHMIYYPTIHFYGWLLVKIVMGCICLRSFQEEIQLCWWSKIEG